MFLYNDFRLGVKRAMARALTVVMEAGKDFSKLQ